MAFSQAGAETHEELVSRYLEVSGYRVPESELGLKIASVQDGFAKSIELKSPVFWNRFRQEVIDIYSANLDDDTLLKLIAWHESRTGKKTHPKKERNTTSKEELDAFLVDFSKSPNAVQRLELMNKLDWISRFTESTSELEYDFSTGAINAFRRNVKDGCSEDKRNNSLADVAMEKRRCEYIAHRKNALFNTLLFKYKKLTDEELKTCIAFYETDAGRRETAAKYLMLKKLVEYRTDLYRKYREMINNTFTHRINNAMPKENGKRPDGGVSAVELPDSPAGLE
jgi:hypothetical protein